MSHRHVPGWKLCDLCGIRYPADCPKCRMTHVRLHHNGRRLRRLAKIGAKR